MPGVFDEAEQKLKNPNPFDQAERQFKSSQGGPGRGGKVLNGTAAKVEDPNVGSPLHPMATFATGAEQLVNPGGNRPGEKLKGLHNVITGGSELAAPLAVESMVQYPLRAVGGLIGGAAGGAAGKLGSKFAGASDDVSDLAGDAGAVGGGLAGARLKLGSGLIDRLIKTWKETAFEKPKAATPKTKSVRREPAWKAGPGPAGDEPKQQFESIKPGPKGPKPGPKSGNTAERLRDELGGAGEVDPETGIKTIPQPEDVRAADRAKLSPRGKGALVTPKAGANASAHPERSAMLSEALKAVGFSPEAAKSLKPEDWHAIAQQVGIDTPNQATIDAAIKSLM